MAIKISGSTIIDDSRVLVNTGNVGVGTTNPDSSVDPGNTNIVHAGIVTANFYYGDGSGLTNVPISGIATDAQTLDGLDSTQFLRSDVADTKVGVTTFQDDATFQGNVDLGDDDRLRFGDAQDLQIWHNSTNNNSVIQESGTGDLNILANDFNIRNQAGNETIAQFKENAEVSLNYDNSKKFETTTNGVTVTGVLVADGVDLGDSERVRLGDGNDLQIFHDGSDDIISSSGSTLKITGSRVVINNAANNENQAVFTEDGAVELYYDNSKKFETTTTGITVSNGASTSATIAGPDEIIIDPATVGDNTGSVRIKGDLFVDGTQTIINSSTIELADFIVGIASTATTDTLADGAGIQIGPDNTFLYEYNSGTNPSLKSSENLNVASGKVYQIAETERLSANTLSLGTGTTIHSPASNILTFGTNGDERVRIDNVGDVTLNLSPGFRDEGVLKFGRADGVDRSHYIRVYNDSIDSENYMKFQVHGGTVGSFVTPLTLFGDSKVGINTDSATQDLDVNGNVRFRNALYDNTNSDGDPNQILTSTGSGVQWVTGTTAASGTEILSQQASTPYYITASDVTSGVSTAGFIDTTIVSKDGRIGIGTDNPTQRVEVEGTDGARVAFTNTGTRRWSIGNAEDASTSFTITDQSASSEKLRIDINGDVGIGTDNPQYKLQVEGDIKLANTGTIWFDDTASTVEKISATGSTIDLYADSLVRFYESDANTLAFTVDTNNARAFFVGDDNTYWYHPAADTHAFVNAGSESVRINSSGDVGIGTDNPDNTLHVQDGTIQVGKTEINGLETLIGENALQFNRDTSPSYIDQLGTGDIRFRYGASNTTWMHMEGSNGNIGIGTDSPSQTLDVNGIVRLRSEIRDSNDSAGTSGYVLASNGPGSAWTWQSVTSVGAAASDKITEGDTSAEVIDTGSDGRFVVTTDNQEILRVNSTGVGIGTDNPTHRLHVAGNAKIGATTGAAFIEVGEGATANRNAYIDFTGDTTYTDYGLRVIRGDGGANTDSFIIHRGTGALNIQAKEAGSIEFFTSDTERMRIDSSGRLLVGTSSTFAVESFNRHSYFCPITGETNNQIVISATGTSGFPGIYFTKTRGSTPSTQTIVQDGDILGSFRFFGSDGTDYANASAEIRCNVDGTPGANDRPGRLVFLTTSDGASSPTERMRITSGGDVGIGTDNPGYKLEVNGSFAATTKSFVIDHPTKEGMKLRYGSLEGPENGVYVRGRLNSTDTIELPDYWTGLVDEETITVNLTPIGVNASLHSVVDIVDNTIIVGSASGEVNCFYTVFGERKDVEKLEVEF